MSLTKLLGSKLSLFKKDVISFVIIRRHDLGVSEDTLRYLAVRPNASVASLRRRVWHLLELPDFCDEVIVLRSTAGADLPLTELRVGNSPQQPFLLEVWSRAPLQPQNDFSKLANMLTLGDGVSLCAADSRLSLSLSIADEPHTPPHAPPPPEDAHNTRSARQIPLKETVTLNNRPADKPAPAAAAAAHGAGAYLLADKSELARKLSASCVFRKLGGVAAGGAGGGRGRARSRDNLTSVLLQIQSDLNALTTKMSYLETRLVEK